MDLMSPANEAQLIVRANEWYSSGCATDRAGARPWFRRWHLPQKENVPMVYLQITLKVRADRRPAAAEVYRRYRAPFLSTVTGATSKELLVRDDDVQVLHGFDSRANAEAYLKTPLFERDVVTALSPLLDAPPDVRVYTVA
jgi:quinol monooxygenase YgiN